MTPTEFFVAVRLWLNDSTEATYKWTTTELVQYYNHIMDELAAETDYFADGYTAGIFNLTLSPGYNDYALDSRVLQIISARIAGETEFLTQTSLRQMNDEDPTRRYGITISATDISFADNGASADTMASTTTDFISEDLVDDDYISVSGATSASNTGIFQVDTVAEHLLTMKSTVALATEAAGDQVVIRQVEVDTPKKFMLDYREGYITLSPAPDAAGTLLLEAIRDQLTALTVATIGTATIPIKSDYHNGLIDGVLSRAYLKSGPSTFNIEKSKIHMGLFAGLKNKIKMDRIKLQPSKTLAPSSGTL